MNVQEWMFHQRLLAAPDAFENESRASWVQRLCGAHGYSMTRLRQISAMQTQHWDWDYEISIAAWTSLLEMAGLQRETCGQAIFGLGLLTKQFAADSVLLGLKRRPQYRWCSLCMAQDQVPYLRWEWRLTDLAHCHVHRVPLLEKCPWCGCEMHLHRAILVSAGPRNGVQDLATCGSCGMSLADGGASSTESCGTSELSAEQALLESLLIRLKLGYSEADSQMAFDFSDYGCAIPNALPVGRNNELGKKQPELPSPKNTKAGAKPLPSRPSKRSGGEISFATAVSRTRSRSQYSLFINGDTFKDGFVLASPESARLKWSRNLSDMSRAKVSRALKVVRAEWQAMGLRPGGAAGSTGAGADASGEGVP